MSFEPLTIRNKIIKMSGVALELIIHVALANE